jgi:uncharacterized protein YgiM (DUF1202 family)
MRKWLFATLLTVFACGVVPLPEQTPTPTESPSPSVSECQAVVIAEHLNIRSCPGTYCKGLDVLAEGQQLEVVLSRGEWLKVYVNGKVGWVNSAYVDECS